MKEISFCNHFKEINKIRSEEINILISDYKNNLFFMNYNCDNVLDTEKRQKIPIFINSVSN